MAPELAEPTWIDFWRQFYGPVLKIPITKIKIDLKIVSGLSFSNWALLQPSLAKFLIFFSKNPWHSVLDHSGQIFQTGTSGGVLPRGFSEVILESKLEFSFIIW